MTAVEKRATPKTAKQAAQFAGNGKRGPNEAGVFPHATRIEVPIPKSLKVKVAALLAEHDGIFRNAFDVQTGTRSHSFMPSVKWGNEYPDRNAAIRDALDGAKRILEEQARTAATTEAANCEKAIGHLEKFSRRFRSDFQAPAASAETTAAAGSIVRLPIERLEPHPDNPRKHFDQAKLKELAGSFKTHGMLTPLLVRPIAGGKWQIIGGERRYRAAKLAKLTEAPCQVREMADATAIELLTVDNENRENLLPLEKAAGVELLHRPVEQGGAGLTLEQAARRLGYSASWAKNIVRLLRLPEVWQRRVNSGELPERLARLLIPYASIEPLMEEIDENYQECMADVWDKQEWADERGVQAQIAHCVALVTRPMDAGEKYRPEDITIDGVHLGWHQVGYHTCLFKPSDEQLEQLGLVTIDGKRRATNLKLFDELQRPLLEAKLRKQLSKPASKKKTVGSPAEQAAAEKQKAKDRAAKLKQALDDWYHVFLRHLVAESLESCTWQVAKLAIWLLPRMAQHRWCSQHADPLVNDACALAYLKFNKPKPPGTKRTVLDLSTVTTDDALHAVVVAALVEAEHGYQAGKLAEIDHELILALVADCRIDVAAGWGKAQRKDAPARLRQQVFDFLNLHTKGQLEKLAAELGENIHGKSTKPAIVDHLATVSDRGRVLKLPKAIAARIDGKAKPARRKR